jgi:hypothetical protein
MSWQRLMYLAMLYHGKTFSSGQYILLWTMFYGFKVLLMQQFIPLFFMFCTLGVPLDVENMF